MNFYRFNQILNEKAAGLEVESDNLEDIIAGVRRLPDTIHYISAPRDLFGNPKEYLAPKDTTIGGDFLKGTPNWRERVIEQLMKLRDEVEASHRKMSNTVHSAHYPSWDQVDDMVLRSHTGTGRPDDSYYIQVSDPKHREFRISGTLD